MTLPKDYRWDRQKNMDDTTKRFTFPQMTEETFLLILDSGLLGRAA
jgi:hypothetical protein